ncbi:MAG: hypothetical protein FJ125_18590 [Deltaproteobacteria bacterium]|nr:hypothetical protein [Deltaproteobacteria bacterium]
MSEEQQQGPGREAVWRLFRDQQERCAGCGVRLKWDELGVRGRAGGWVVAEEQEAVFSCICFKCLDHVGPRIKFHLVAR